MKKQKKSNNFILHPSSFILYPLSFILFFILSFILYPLSFVSAVPQAMCIYYGQALDKYGWPYMSDADVIMRSGTNEIARHTITGSLEPGVNFALYVSLDDGSEDKPYSDIAIEPGDPINIVVRDADGEHNIMSTNALPVPEYPGQVIMVNVTAGIDSDHDGMSDAWEQEIVDLSTNPAITSIEDVKPGDDYDGDGASNWEEYRSGNFAFLDYDYLFIEHLLFVGGRMELELLSVPGKAYTVECATNIMSGPWIECPLAPTETGALVPQYLEGDGDWLPLYVDYANTNGVKFYRLKVK